ncbi:MAG: pyridoxamine 5'-phosphate oxidase family protein [Mycolicibacterium sp.]|nr:pyridoxamine 5'-phosphate oxidase family protein [Mycolicibacterium sp.]
MENLKARACEELLRRNEIGRLACFSPRPDETYIVPISIRYHDGAIHFACLPGQKLEYLREHPTGVCFEVEEVDGRGGWCSVVVIGTVTAPSGWEHLQQGFATMRRVSRGPLRTKFAAVSAPASLDDLIFCVLRPAKITGRKDQWFDEVKAPPRAPDMHDQPLIGLFAG